MCGCIMNMESIVANSEMVCVMAYVLINVVGGALS